MTGTDIEPEAPSPSVPPPTEVDRSLAREASRGDDGAFAAIYERHHAAIHRYCASMLGEHDAADALQGAMTKALVALRDGDAPRDLRPWLYRIAHNESVDMIRERRSRSALGDAVELETGASAGVAPSPADQSEERQRLQRLIADIRSLPERQRGAILMRELSGLSTTEIAAALETSEPTAKQAVYEARVALTEIQEGREMPCEPVQRAISDGDRRVLRGRQVRAHLRGCERCQAFAAAIDDRSQTLHSYAPVLPAVLAGGILQQVLGAAGSAGGASAAAAGTGAAAAGAGVAGAGGAAALSGGVAKLAAIAAATLAIGAGGYEGLRATGLIKGGGEERAVEAGSGGPAGPEGSSAASGGVGGGDDAENASAGGSGSDPSSGGASNATADNTTAGGRRGSAESESRGGSNGSGNSDEGAVQNGGTATEQTEDLPEAASDGQERAESQRPDHAGRPDEPGSRAGSNSRGAERSAGGRERAEQGGRGSSGSNRGGNSDGSNRGGNSDAAGERGRGQGATGSGGSSNGQGGGNATDRADRVKPERGEGSGGGASGERESRAGSTTGRPSDETRQERGERPS